MLPGAGVYLHPADLAPHREIYVTRTQKRVVILATGNTSPQARSVVAADVNHVVAGCQVHTSRDSTDLPTEMSNH